MLIISIGIDFLSSNNSQRQTSKPPRFQLPYMFVLLDNFIEVKRHYIEYHLLLEIYSIWIADNIQKRIFNLQFSNQVLRHV